MRHPTRTARRSGFTLIELLVVLAIIAVLASLVISAVFALQTSQMKSFSEATVLKLASALDQQVKAVLDQIYEESPTAIAMALANNDIRRGRVIHTKLRLAQEFPSTFNQVRGQAPFAPNPIGPKPAYIQALPATSVPQDWESSALLYLSLKQGRRGMASFDAATLVEPTAIQTRSIGGKDFDVFVDGWGRPLRFYMFPFDNNELNAAPYLTSNTAATGRDNQDPEDTLLVPSWRYSSGNTLSPNALTFARYCHRIPSLLDPNPNVKANSNFARVMVPVIASAGRDGLWGLDDTPLTSPTMLITLADAQQDNIYSYRLRRFGQRGD